MKYVRSLNSEPELLEKYRRRNPNEDLRPMEEAKSVWDNFTSDRDAYEQVCRALVLRQQGLCLYCEQRLVDTSGKLLPLDYQVEHVLAKSATPGSTLDWTNLAMACGGGTYRYHKDESRRYTSKTNISCGQAKEDHDLPPGCDPRRFPLLNPLVKIGLSGELVVDQTNCAAEAVDHLQMSASIKLLKLDCERLRMTRQNMGDNVRKWFNSLLVTIVALPDLTMAQKQEKLYMVVAQYLQPDGVKALPAFWSTGRSAIGDPAEVWINANQTLLR